RAFRPYVLTVVRRLAVSDAARRRRAMPTPEMEAFAPLLPFEDPVLAALEASLVGRAFAALPERWQTVLWHTEVEGESPAQVAPLLGLSANGAAALACRAREGLRKEYLQAHLCEQEMARECRRCAKKLAAYLRGSLGERDRSRVEEHLAGCERCPRLLLELREVSGRLRGILAPLILGPVFAGYFAPLVEASQAPPQSQAPQASQTPQAPPDETTHQAADGPDPGADGDSGGGAADGDSGDGDDEGTGAGSAGDDGGTGAGSATGAGSSGPGAVAVTVSVVAGLTVLTVTAVLILSPGPSSHPRAGGREPAATSAPTPPQPSSAGPSSSGPTPSAPMEPGPGGRHARPRPNPSRSTPPGDSDPSQAGTPAPSSPAPTPSPRPPSGSVMSDGSFESQVTGQPVTYYGTGDTIGPWQVVQGSVNLVRSGQLQAADGQQSIDMNGDPPGPAAGAIAQTFPTTAGRPYTVSFRLAGNPTCAPVAKTLRADIGTVTRDFSFDTTGHSATDMGWREETVRFTAQSSRTTLRLTSTTDPNSRCGPEIDTVKATAG
ncbi:choice-of-anchor C family protein, partial [Streptomyces sp. NPDC048506]|uniref:choice-of-anchor C family protein n=1 Tax=Streptomyces sp. NPDC048506 TaxID=3155028 RepID=UPI00341BB051